MDDPKVIDAIVILYLVLRIAVVTVIVTFLLLKALVFRRAGRFGDALSKSNAVLAIAYIGTLLLLIGLDFFRTTPWVLGTTTAVAIYVVKAAYQMKILYGSWKQVGSEAKAALGDIRTYICDQPLGFRIVMFILILEFWTAVVLVEVKGTPRELILPTMLVQLEKTPTPAPPTPTSRPRAAVQNDDRPLPRPIRVPTPTPLPDLEEARKTSQSFVPIRISEARLQAWAAINPCAKPLGSDWVCLVQHQPIAQPPYGY